MNIQITTHQVNLLTVNALCKLQFLLNDALHKCGLCLWMDRHLSVHPALCLSHTGILSKWQNIFSRFFHCLVAHHSDISVPNFRFQIFGQITPKLKIFENVFLDSSTGHWITFRGQIWWKSVVAKLPKGRLATTQKIRGLRRTRPSPLFCPKWADLIQNSLNVVTPWPVHVYRIWSRSAVLCWTYSGKIDFSDPRSKL